tara:strand:+ start:1134 stop:1271 length:138 start_codon:yes stop_codon:yes gene_type:complete
MMLLSWFVETYLFSFFLIVVLYQCFDVFKNDLKKLLKYLLNRDDK